MILSDRAEEILERLGVELIEQKKEVHDAGILKDDEALKELVNLSYLKIKAGQFSLTDEGKEEARSCVRRHRLAERLLVDILDAKKGIVHERGCKFEHLLHKGLDDNICTLLGHPKTCPHGRPIPEGECCKDAKRAPKKLIMPLFELELNKKAKIAYLQTHNRSILQKIIAIGALPHSEVVLLQNFPSYVFQIGKAQFTVDQELASHIYVRVS
ncbi:MAG: metal-dependent transcriptional regulator [Omnitrophica bacterium]|nr:metal-dependent transcriptional regulator [Candidatus Omnitrophota bacterium]